MPLSSFRLALAVARGAFYGVGRTATPALLATGHAVTYTGFGSNVRLMRGGNRWQAGGMANGSDGGRSLTDQDLDGNGGSLSAHAGSESAATTEGAAKSGCSGCGGCLGPKLEDSTTTPEPTKLEDSTPISEPTKLEDITTTPEPTTASDTPPIKTLSRPIRLDNPTKSRAFHADRANHGLILSVTRRWTTPPLPRTSKEWRRLRSHILTRDTHTCRFCGLRAKKYMGVDHIDGDVANNHPENLGLTCAACRMILQCGVAAKKDKLVLLRSGMAQVDIVRRTWDLYCRLRRMPEVEEVDPHATEMVVKGSDGGEGVLTVIEFAKMLYRHTYSELPVEYLQCKGFFTRLAEEDFERMRVVAYSSGE
ncbi:hypothetical protein HK104_001125 [Borealophlyctis nickersoniae]|nr:hypothetical protein HK104_001125 [Borealophlyctis nickersoniae]